MSLLGRFIQEKDLADIIERLCDKMTVSEKKTFYANQIDQLIELITDKVSESDKEELLDSLKKSTLAAIDKASGPELKNPDYMCC
jgi:hypothetical protein